MTFDYFIHSVSSEPAGFEGLRKSGEGFVFAEPDAAEENGETIYRTEVAVRRSGEGYFPVDVLMVFEDGHEIRHRWADEDRWKIFIEERPAKLRHAIVDPDRVLLLDLDYTNNSRLLEPAPVVPAVKWASKWMIWLQDFLATFTFFV